MHSSSATKSVQVSSPTGSPGLVQAACPVCVTSEARAIFTENCEGTDFTILVCNRCGMGYSDPQPTEEYKRVRYQRWAEAPRPWQAEAHYDHRQQLRHFHLYRRVMQCIERRIPRGRILDVGCGGGLFLIFAGVYSSEHSAGINSAYEADGAGFDPREIELSRQVSGARVWSLSELGGLPDASYDAITLLNVLEHVNHPRNLLQELRRLLRPGGPLVVVVPNNEIAFWKLQRGLNNQASFAASEHINHFRTKPLARLLGNAGFAKVQFEPALPSGTLGSIAKVPARQLVKHAGYRLLDVFSAGRMYLYSEIVCIAE